MPDLLDRLTDANPVTDPRPSPDEADALLQRILAEPPARRAPSRRLLRPLAAAAGVACAAGIAVAAIDIAGPDEPTGGVIDRAVAAVSEDDVIYHVVEHFTGRYVTDDRRALDAFDSEGLDLFEDDEHLNEYWFGPGERNRQRVHDAADGRRGRLRAEMAMLSDPPRTWYYDAASDRLSIGCVAKQPLRPRREPLPPAGEFLPGLRPGEDAGLQLRALHEQGRLRVVDTVEVDGREAYRLSSNTIRGPEEGHTERIEFLVDAETYLPIQQRNFSTQQGIPGLPRNEYSDVPVTGIFTRDFVVYERLPLTEENLAVLKPTPRPGAEVDRHGCD